MQLGKSVRSSKKVLQASLASLALILGVSLSNISLLSAPAFAEPGLAYDSDHDVLALPDCDLAIRYNSKTFVPVKAVTTADGTDFFLKEKPIRAFKIYEDYSSAGMKAAPEQIIVEIYDVSKIGAFGTSRFNKTFMGNNRVREVQFTNERVGKEIGLTDTAFTGITAVKSYEVVGKNGATPVYLYVMQTPKHMICFARTMRGTSREFDLDPAVIVTQMRVNNAGNSVGNIQLPDPTPAAATTNAATPADSKSTN
jgi:hypothetical protein